jgi:hypothetical protein
MLEYQVVPAYKRQHYLPAVYLKEFSGDRKPTRNSLIWRYDGSLSRQVPVESQCAEDYFYSKERPAEAEKVFHGMENLYPKFLARVKAKQNPTGYEYFGLILMMLDLHLRGAAYLNETGGEGIAAYRMRFHAFKQQLLLGGLHESPTDDQVAEHLRACWRVRVLESVSGNQFLTSDHPSAWASLFRHRKQLDIVVLPLTPRFTAVAFDKRVVDVTTNCTTAEDEGRLNRCQVVQALRAVYTSAELDAENRNWVGEIFAKKRQNKGQVNRNSWQATLLDGQHFREFSFLRSVTPELVNAGEIPRERPQLFATATAGCGAGRNGCARWAI